MVRPIASPWWPAALMSYGPNVDGLYRSAAVYVDKILKGAKPADLPVEQATKLTSSSISRQRRHSGITIPLGVLFQADQGDPIGEAQGHEKKKG